MLVILAHGALGWYDELVFLGIITIFIGMMIVSWFRSRSMAFEEDDLMPQQTRDDTAANDERFTLE